MSDTRLLVNGMTVDQLIDFHRGRFGDLRMADDGDDGQQPDATSPAPDTQDVGKQQEQATFTQADIDKVVKERVQRERAKYADYDELKKQAEGKKSADDRIADLESRYAAAEARALRANIANAHGISAEDADLFLTGSDEDTLTAQAKRLAERDSERKKQGNVVPKEGTNPSSSSADGDRREFVRRLTGKE